MQQTSVFKFLYLLNLLSKKDYTKNQIIEEFLAINIKITKTLINNYIDKFLKNGIEIEISKNDKLENVYHLKKEKIKLTFKDEELDSIYKAKKLLMSEKNYNRIRQTMRLFYKLAMSIEDDNIKRQFIDFGYYSKINWSLIMQLEKHCKNKDIIEIDYILPDKTNDFIVIQADKITFSDWSWRMYLYGIVESKKQYYSFPIDRIFMIRKVIKEKQEIQKISNKVRYIVSKKIFNETTKDIKEIIVKEENGRVEIERPLDDEFYLLQRFMCFCPDLYFISDNKLANMYKNKLEKLKEIYG